MALSQRCFRSVFGMLLAAGILPVAAEPNLRSTFPGRRVGGGTRGECTARFLVHLVPESSVFAPGDQPWLGVLQGPTQAPKPLLVDLRRLVAAGTADDAQDRLRRLRFPASEAGVSLFRAPLAEGVVWESSYQCIPAKPGDESDEGETGFDAPPAISLLLSDATAVDRSIQDRLATLRGQCGRSVSKQQLIADFNLSNLDLSRWPDPLPVRCLP